MTSPANELATLAADLRAWLDWQACTGAVSIRRESVQKTPASGVERLPAPPQASSAPPAPGPPLVSTPTPRPPGDMTATTSARWAALRDGPPTHTQTGPVGAELMVVRSAGSGAEAEQMFDRMITNVLGIERSAVLVVDLAQDARPVETIGNGLVGALGQLRPANILIMGSFGARALLGPDQDVAQARGKWLELCWDDGACPVRVTHHPEAILALEAKGQMAPKQETFEDLKAVAAVLFEDPSPA